MFDDCWIKTKGALMMQARSSIKALGYTQNIHLEQFSIFQTMANR